MIAGWQVAWQRWPQMPDARWALITRCREGFGREATRCWIQAISHGEGETNGRAECGTQAGLGGPRRVWTYSIDSCAADAAGALNEAGNQYFGGADRGRAARSGRDHTLVIVVKITPDAVRRHHVSPKGTEA